MKAVLDALIAYGLEKGLIQPGDETYVFNRLLEILQLDEVEEEAGPLPAKPLSELLDALTDDAVRRGLLDDNITARDLFDTRLMGALTPWPHEVRRHFEALREIDPITATDWYYRFSCDTNYIRRDRIAKDVKWVYSCEYGDLDITINLSKPEKEIGRAHV